MQENSLNSQSLLTQFEKIVGASNVLVAPGHDLAAYEQDWRQRSRGKALAVVRPGDTEQVAAVVLACAEAKKRGLNVSIVPQGGNTGLVLGSIPDQTGCQVVLSLSRMNQVLALDTANLTMTVQTGCVLQTIQAAASQAGFLFPLSLAAQGSCQIGGNLATNAGGTQVLRYGNARELCLGLEVVTAKGEVWNGLSGLRKDNTGYDLRNLLIGSEGTLGIMTAATLKLFPKPLATMTAWAAVPSLEAAVKFLGMAQSALGSGLTGFEVMGLFAVSLVAKHFPQLPIALWNQNTQNNLAQQESGFFVLLENADSQSTDIALERFDAFMAQALEASVITDAVIAQSMAQAAQMWHVRESIPLAQAEEGLNIKHDISVPVSAIAAFCFTTDAHLRQAIPGVRLVNFGHVGDGNLHYNVQCPADGPFAQDSKAFLKQHEKQVHAIVYDNVQQFGGSFSAEHGVGSLKRDELVHYKSAVALDMMRAIKSALDPQNLLNPGRVL
jgi:FAD/FMN-containing dehydrogenase